MILYKKSLVSTNGSVIYDDKNVQVEILADYTVIPIRMRVSIWNKNSDICLENVEIKPVQKMVQVKQSRD